MPAMRPCRALWLALAMLLFSACTLPPVNKPTTRDQEKQDGPTLPAHPALPPGGVPAAGLPYYVLRADGREIDKEEFYREVLSAQAICVGETHTNAHHHWVQLTLLDKVTEAAKTSGKKIALGLEMLPYGVQGVLDDYTAGTIDEAAMLERTAWKTRWTVQWEHYQPLIQMAQRRGAQILALNAPPEITRTVTKKGLDGLTPEQRDSLPDLDLTNRSHRAYFKDAMEESKHPLPEDGIEKIYTSMVIWDETMGNNSAKWLRKAPRGKRQLVIIAGSGHCRNDGTTGRLRRRVPHKVISIKPVVMSEGDSTVSDLLVKPETDFVFVMKKDAPPPKAKTARPK